jgi:copper(I)-binding protein
MLTIGALLAALAAPAFAAENTITVDGAWARPSLGAGGASAAYFTIHNHGADADTLTGVSTPSATAAALHESRLENGVAKMLPVQSVDIPAGAAVALEPRGKHVMLMGLTQPLKVGDSIVLTLKLKNAGAINVTAPIRNGPPDAMGGMDMSH